MEMEIMPDEHPDSIINISDSEIQRDSLRGKLKVFEEGATSSAISLPVEETPLLTGDLLSSQTSPDVRSQLGMLAKRRNNSFLEEDYPGKSTHCSLLVWVTLIVLIAVWGTTRSISKLRYLKPWGLKLSDWEVMFLAVLGGRILSVGTLRMILFLIKRNLFLRKKVFYFFNAVKNTVVNSLWVLISLVAWHLLVSDKRVLKETENSPLKHVTNFLICLLVGFILWAGKTLLGKYAASHLRMSYLKKIQRSFYNQFIFEVLTGPPPPSLEVKKDEDETTIDYIQNLNQDDVSFVVLKRLGKILRNGALTTADGKTIEKEDEAKAAAEDIFVNVKGQCSCISDDHLKKYMRKDQVIKTMMLFEGRETGEISQSTLINWLVNSWKERRALASSLEDIKGEERKLHCVLTVIYMMLMAPILLFIIGVATIPIMVFVSFQFVFVSFTFGNTLKNIVEAILLLFVMHPFDVGDRCTIDEIEMTVEKINLLSVVFRTDDNEEAFIPNRVLLTKVILNSSR